MEWTGSSMRSQSTHLLIVNWIASSTRSQLMYTFVDCWVNNIIDKKSIDAWICIVEHKLIDAFELIALSLARQSTYWLIVEWRALLSTSQSMHSLICWVKSSVKYQLIDAFVDCWVKSFVENKLIDALVDCQLKSIVKNKSIDASVDCQVNRTVASKMIDAFVDCQVKRIIESKTINAFIDCWVVCRSITQNRIERQCRFIRSDDWHICWLFWSGWLLLEMQITQRLLCTFCSIVKALIIQSLGDPTASQL